MSILLQLYIIFYMTSDAKLRILTTKFIQMYDKTNERVENSLTGLGNCLKC